MLNILHELTLQSELQNIMTMQCVGQALVTTQQQQQQQTKHQR